jgi:hypothetical protein
MLPVFRGVIEVREQPGLIGGQGRRRLGVLGAVLGGEPRDGLLGGGAALGVHDLVQGALGPRLQARGELVQDVAAMAPVK